ncbi:hypothetical protein RB195_002501 [Necator americanus]|uniref:Uncharacterized protein n=1 Tax=Necator americanus TaxID=51031 RepID=A0ABR1DM77_NECAM
MTRTCDFEATSSQGSSSACDINEVPDETGYNNNLDHDVVINKDVARTTVSGLELLMLYLEAEIHRARAFIREYGARIRRFFREGIHIDFRSIARHFAVLADRRSSAELSDLNQDAAMIFNVLFNRPLKMSMTIDDDDERLSLPSTMVTDQELKIQSLEAQLALLSKQMQSLLSGKGGSIGAVATGHIDSSPFLSDDEGKGTSLCSPSDTVKITSSSSKRLSALPEICPPAGLPPPPPPPPPALSTSSCSVSKNVSTPSKRTVLQMLNKSANVDHEALPLRPSVFDLTTVQLRKTNAARSPGGTPVVRHSSAQNNTDEVGLVCVSITMQGNYLAMALREKFRSVQESLSEHEDEVNTSWLEDDAN